MTTRWPGFAVLLGSGVAFSLCAVPDPPPLEARLGMVAAALAMAAAGGWLVWKGVQAREVLLVAVLLRAFALPLPPVLSDDAFRYLWDGRIQAAGFNPYAFLPDDPALAAYQAEPIYDRLNSVPYYSVYPAPSQLVFAGVGWLYDPAHWTVSYYLLKLVLMGCELAALALLLRLAPLGAVALYAWHPMVVMETAGQVHTEALMLPFLVGVFWALQRGRPRTALAALTVAGWVKLVPLLFLPLVLRRVGWRQAWVPVVVSAVLWVPYAAPYVVPHLRASVDLYAGYFAFNAGPTLLLRAALEQGWPDVTGRQIGHVLRGLFLVALPLVYLLDARRGWSLPGAMLAIWGLFIAQSTTVHPWYLLGIAVLLPLVPATSRHRVMAVGWYGLALGAVGTYVFYTGRVDLAVLFGGGAWIWWMAAMAVAGGLALLPRLMQARARLKWAWLSRHLPPPTGLRVLDLGAGEGFVGMAAHRAGATVTLADVVDFHQSPLPHVRYDGRHLPFPAASFDAVLVVFVLHHAEDAGAVLREARRVCGHGGNVVVLESVYEQDWDHRLLRFLDQLANRVRSGGLMRAQEEHLHFRTATAWRGLMEQAGFSVVHEARRGRWVHRQHLFVLRVPTG